MNHVAPSTDVSYYTDQLGTGAVVAIVVFAFAFWLLFVIAYVKIISKAGYSGWWILVMLIPLVNVIMLLVFAFKEWPIQREVRELRGRPGGGYGSVPGYGGQAGY